MTKKEKMKMTAKNLEESYLSESIAYIEII